jgi:hypothetical protein
MLLKVLKKHNVEIDASGRPMAPVTVMPSPQGVTHGKQQDDYSVNSFASTGTLDASGWSGHEVPSAASTQRLHQSLPLMRETLRSREVTMSFPAITMRAKGLGSKAKGGYKKRRHRVPRLDRPPSKEKRNQASTLDHPDEISLLSLPSVPQGPAELFAEFAACLRPKEVYVQA